MIGRTVIAALLAVSLLVGIKALVAGLVAIGQKTGLADQRAFPVIVLAVTCLVVFSLLGLLYLGLRRWSASGRVPESRHSR